MQAIMARLEEIAALLVAVAGLITVLGMAGLTQGAIVDAWVGILWRWLGWGALAFPVLIAAVSVRLARRALGLPSPIRYTRLIAVEIAYLTGLGLMSLATGLSLAAAEDGWGGGIIGWGISRLIADVLGKFGAAVILGILFLAFVSFAIFDWLQRRGTVRQAVTRLAEVATSETLKPATTSRVGRRRRMRLPPKFRKDFEIGEKEEGIEPALERPDVLPPLDLLEQGGQRQVTAAEINRSAGIIEKTLMDFGLPARVVNFRTGPSVTQFAVEPGYVEHTGSDGESRKAKVRVSQISALASDLALALSAPRLRIEAPVPGQPYVGIEVPNRHGEVVRLRGLLQSRAFQELDSPLAIALGRDVAGASVVADLAAMPHLLVAGTTGSGKSVAITALATCLAMNNSPDDLKLVMIDPKMVELLRFNGLPHLFGNVETELERIVGVLRWCTDEMDRRYRVLEEARARDLDAFNRAVLRKGQGNRLPRIVVFLDELADLMLMAPDQTEKTLVRLAQMARAVGIHLVVATQRPSTDIVTGLIKANFPARISFATASSTDSRVILDTPGAETLLGKGDLLYLSPEASAPNRLQGAYVGDQEVERVIRFWQSRDRAPRAEEEVPPWEQHLARQEVLEELDDLVERAIQLVSAEGEASASLLQRRLRVGYPRAARLMDELEELGVIGRPRSGGKTREVLIRDGDDPLAEAEGDMDG
jgi:S-DNA-T family DNA segregation ATPase FtsK/SpoIIIE